MNKKRVKADRKRVFPQRVEVLRIERGNRCECKGCRSCGLVETDGECGSVFKLEFAHVAPTDLKGEGRGQTQRYYDIKANPSRYKLLCNGCHIELDNKTTTEGT